MDDKLGSVASEESKDEQSKPSNSLPPLEIPESLECESGDGEPNQEFVPATPSLLIPSMRGKLIADGTLHICRGVWAMSDEAHDQPGQTSDFEFKLVKPYDNQLDFPVNGKYQGWFILKQPLPLKPSTMKVEEKEIVIRFIPFEARGHRIEGEGSNKFGSYTLRGTLSEDGMLQMYREYVTRPLSAKHKSVELGKAKKKVSEKLVVEVVVPTPREGGRVRKKSNFGSGFDLDGFSTCVTSRHSVVKVVEPTLPLVSPKPQLPMISMSPRAESGRAPRQSLHMQKCSELLKEMVKQPHSVWFVEPVDFVKLSIPDYPTIITQPMDFKTIRQNLEGCIYTTPEAFADHMRLVFRNAIQYNQLRDNPVHIAAREMAGRFEEKYRLMMSQLGSSITASYVEPTLKSSAVAALGRKTNAGAKTPRGSNNGNSSGKGKNPIAPGPRATDAFLPPPALDTGAHHIYIMQKQMEEMQNEIMKLRTAVRQTEVQAKIEEKRDAAHHPLSYDEKKKLIGEIHRLPHDRMEQVVELIRTALPSESKDDGEEIEIPLDELDTHTLRKLQKFVADSLAEERKKKRPAPHAVRSSNGVSTGTMKGEPNPKKVKRSVAVPTESVSRHAGKAKSRDSGNSASSSDGLIVEDDIEEETSDLLFQFDDLHSQPLDGDEDYDMDGDDQATNQESSRLVGGDGEEAFSNVDAWTRDANTKNEDMSSAIRGKAVDIQGKGIWSEVAGELEAEKKREVERKAAEDCRLAEQKVKLEAGRVSRSQYLQQGHENGPPIVLDMVPDADSDEHPASLQQQREEERKRLEGLQPNISFGDVHRSEEMMEMFNDSVT